MKNFFSLICFLGLIWGVHVNAEVSMYDDSNIFHPLDEVNPISKLGKLIVAAPTLNFANHKDYYITITPKKGSSLTQLELDRAYSLEEQEICLSIGSNRGASTKPHVSDTFCGFQVVRGQILKIELVSFQLTAKDTYSVNVGPMLGIDVLLKPENNNVVSAITIPNHMMEVIDYDASYIVPLGTLKINFRKVGSKVLTGKTFDIITSRQLVDITPEDVRQKLIVNITETPKFDLHNDVYSSASNLVWVTYRSLTNGIFVFQQDAPSNLHQYSESSFVNNGLRYYNSLDIRKKSFVELYAFPAEDAHLYTLDMNGYSTPLAFNQKQDVVPINVHDFDNDANVGVFKMSRLMQNANAYIPIYGYSLNSSNYSVVDVGLLSTKSSIMVPKGYKYKVETFIKDDAGALTPQSIHDLDLTK